MGPEQFLQRPRTMKLLALLFLAAVAYAEPEAKAEAEADPYLPTPDTMDILTHTDMADTMADGVDIMVDTTDIPMAATVISGREMPVKNGPMDRTPRPTLNSYMPTTTTMASLTAPTTTLPLSIITLMPLP